MKTKSERPQAIGLEINKNGTSSKNFPNKPEIFRYLEESLQKNSSVLGNSLRKTLFTFQGPDLFHTFCHFFFSDFVGMRFHNTGSLIEILYLDILYVNVGIL